MKIKFEKEVSESILPLLEKTHGVKSIAHEGNVLNVIITDKINEEEIKQAITMKVEAYNAHFSW